MSGAQIAYLVVLGVCLFSSGFFSGSETALTAVPREKVEQLAETDRRARRVEALVADSDRMLGTLLVANNFVNILGAAVATVLFIDLLGADWGPWVATAVVTAVVLVIGEITPKSLAARYPERFSLVVAPVIWRLALILHPITRFFLSLSRGLFRLFGFDPNQRPAPVTEDDIRAMAVLGEREGDIEAAELDIIHALFGLADRLARDVMTPRTNITVLSAPVTIESVRAAVSRTGHSRFPVIENDLDQVVGVLHVKDLLGMEGEPSQTGIRQILRAAHYVPESKPLLELLQELRAARRAFVLVHDEHGGVEGLLTIKDLISELVGELQDEFDPGPPSIVAVGENQWVADGRLPVDDLRQTVGLTAPAGQYTTLGGLVMDLAGQIPAEGSVVSIEGADLTVLQMDRHRVKRVRLDTREQI